MSRPLRLLLLADALLAAALAVAWFATSPAWEPPPGRPPDPESLAPGDPAAPQIPREALSAMTERPLFEPGRRPARGGNAPEAVAAEPAEALATPTLLGLARGAAGGSAILRLDGEVRRVRPGDRVGPWTLDALGEDGVRLVDETGEPVELVLERAPRPADTPGRKSRAGARPPAGTAPTHTAPAAGEATAEDPITSKSFEQRVAERRAQREAMQRRLENAR